MPPYLRVTPPPRGSIRETTTGRARRAGLPRVRGRDRAATAGTTSAPGNADPGPGGGEGQWPGPQGHAVARRTRPRPELQEVRRAAAAADGPAKRARG